MNKKKVGFNMPKKSSSNADEWIKNRQAPNTKDPIKRFTFDMSLSSHTELKKIAAEQNKKMKNIVNDFITSGLKNIKT